MQLRVTLPILFCTIFLGCFFGAFVAGYFNSEGAASWQLIEPLPDKAVKILDAGIEFVAVQSASGKIYYHAASSDQAWAESTESSVRVGKSQPTFGERPIPDPPGKIVDKFEVNKSAEMIQKAKYAITEDGNVWFWKYTPSMLPQLDGILVGIFVGLFVGVVISIIITARVQTSVGNET